MSISQQQRKILGVLIKEIAEVEGSLKELNHRKPVKKSRGGMGFAIRKMIESGSADPFAIANLPFEKQWRGCVGYEQTTHTCYDRFSGRRW